jgi:type I restriction enzyme M protein
LDVLPNINDTFYSLKYRDSFYVSNQIAHLGVLLLDNKYSDIYIPFTNGFSYSKYITNTIYADNFNTQSQLISELINILEDKKIIFSLTDSLKNPTFCNDNAPHLLKEFNSVLSFPAFRLRGKIEHDKYNRFKLHKGTVLDVAHFEHILAQTKSKAVVLMATGFTFSGGVEEAFRKYLIEQNYLEAIIQLPPNLHSATAIETLFFIINKQKSDDKVQFINLKDEKFITRDGRQLVLKDIDNIVDIYKCQREIENISILVNNKDIVNNNYSLAIDRYVVPKKIKELQTILSNYQTVKLQDISQIRRSQLLKDEGEGIKVYEISPSDFAKAGFTTNGGKVKKIQSQLNRYETYKLLPYDILLSTKGTIGKIAIIGEINNPMVASQASQVIRVKDKEQAIELYMFFKSTIGQAILSQLVAGTAMPQITTSDIKQLDIPLLSDNEKKQVLLNFNNEIKMYNEINKISIDIKQIHNNFLGVK